MLGVNIRRGGQPLKPAPQFFDGDHDYVLDTGDDVAGSYLTAARKLLDRSEVAKR